MFKYLVLVLWMGMIVAQIEQEKPKKPKDIVVNEVMENDGSGNFYWLRETLDGGRSEQIGYLQKGQQVIEGSYTEIDHDGQPLTVNYVADRTGYHPVGFKDERDCFEEQAVGLCE